MTRDEKITFALGLLLIITMAFGSEIVGLLVGGA
jgi:hypothetical protein